MRMRFAFLVLILIATVATLMGQEKTGSLAGTVCDPSNTAVAGVHIEISGPALGRVVQQTTDAAGAYIVPNLPPGIYTVRASAPGFATTKLSGLQLLLGTQLRTTIKLQVAGLQQSIDITERLPLIDVEGSQTAMSLTREDISRIPKQRSFQTLAALAPGAQWENKSGGLQVDGASGSENVWLIDGADTTHLLGGFSSKNLPVDWIQELQVKSNGFGAEYGGAMGGVVHAITKSGGNELHGAAHYYYYGSKLQTSPRPRLRLNPKDARIAEYVHDPKDDETVYDFGFDLSGPVVKNRAWYFLAYQPVLDRIHRDVFFVVPQVTRGYDTHKNAQNWTSKLTLQPWERLRANFTVTSSSGNSIGVLPSYDGTQNPDAGFERRGNRIPNTSFGADASFRATRNLFFNFRLGYFFTDFHALGIGNQLVYTFAGSPQNYFDELAPEFRQLSGWTSGTPNRGQTRGTDTRLVGTADGNWFLHFHGSHSLKFGYQVNRLKQDVLSGSLNDNIKIYFDETHNNVTIPGVTRGQYGYYANFFSGGQGKPLSYDHALYIQDAWRPTHRLTLNLGIRAENETVPSYRTDNGISPTAIRFPFSSKIAPRAGFAYDLHGDGKSKVYGSFGLYYDMMKYFLSTYSFSGGSFTDYYTLDTLDIGSIGHGNYPGQKIERVYVTLPSNAPGKNLIDPNLSPMREHEYTAGYERVLGRGWTLDLRYARKRIDRAVEDVGDVTGQKYFILNPGEGLSLKLFGPGCDPSIAGADCPAFPATPKTSRRYDGMEVRLQGTIAGNFRSTVSYTLSRLYGNYSGLVNSDAAFNGVGQATPNVTVSFDTPYQYVDASARYIDGPLATDRTHTFKYYGSYRIPWGGLGLDVGGVFTAGSGTPTTRVVGVLGGGMFVESRNSDGRRGAYSLTNLYVARDFNVSERSKVRVDFNLENVFNQSTPLDYSVSYTRNEISAGIPGSPIQNNTDAVHGFNYKEQIEVQANYNRPATCGSFTDDPSCPEAPMRLDPQFLKANVFRGPLTGRFGIHFMF